MEATEFFAKPPRAERAFLSPYGSKSLTGLYGVRIETEPLSFIDPNLERELEPEIHLSYLALPTIDLARLENTRFSPASSAKSRYEGSFYFLAQHNWVDLKEIRFFKASGNSILTEYDLEIHLPIALPDEYPTTLQVLTEIKTGDPQLAAPRSFDELGSLVEDAEDMWKGQATYDGQPVEIELSTDSVSLEEIATYARSVVSHQGLPRARMNHEITKWLEILADKFERFNVSPDFHVEDFNPRSFYFYKRRHHDKPGMIIVLEHPADAGHWSLTFYDGVENSILNWVPK